MVEMWPFSYSPVPPTCWTSAECSEVKAVSKMASCTLVISNVFILQNGATRGPQAIVF